jgi:hypothetical protein
VKIKEIYNKLPQNERLLLILIFSITILFSAVIYYLSGYKAPYIPLKTEMEIDTFPKLILNGYLGFLFRFKYVGIFTIFFIPLAAYFIITFKNRPNWQKALFLLYILLSILIAKEGYTNFRYAYTLVPLSLFAVLSLGAEIINKQSKNFNIILLFFLSIMLFFNTSKYFLDYVGYFKNSINSEKNSIPFNVYKYLEQKKIINNNSRLLQIHSASLFYYTNDIYSESYSVSITAKKSRIRGIVSEDTIQNIFNLIENYPNKDLSEIDNVYKTFLDRKIKYILLYPLPEYFVPEIRLFLNKYGELFMSEKGYELYRIKDNIQESSIIFNLTEQYFQYKKRNLYTDGWTNGNAEIFDVNIPVKPNYKGIAINLTNPTNKNINTITSILLNNKTAVYSKISDYRYIVELPENIKEIKSLQINSTTHDMIFKEKNKTYNRTVGVNIASIDFILPRTKFIIHNHIINAGLIDTIYKSEVGSIDYNSSKIYSNGIEGCVQHGPSLFVPKGKYAVTWKFTVKKMKNNKIGHIEIFDNYEKRIIKNEFIKPVKINDSYTFTTEFELKENIEWLDYRFYVNDEIFLEIYQIDFERIN